MSGKRRNIVKGFAYTTNSALLFQISRLFNVRLLLGKRGKSKFGPGDGAQSGLSKNMKILIGILIAAAMAKGYMIYTESGIPSGAVTFDTLSPDQKKSAETIINGPPRGDR